MFGKRPAAATVAALLRDLESPDARVRASAADAAAQVVERTADVAGQAGGGADERANVVGALVARLADAHAEVRAACALALADLRSEEALPALLDAVDDGSVLVRQLAVTALGEIGDARALPRIRRALTDDSPEVRFQAVVAFPRLLGREDRDLDAAWAALRGGLDDDDPHVRARAAEACGELTESGRMPGTIAERLSRLLAKGEPTEVRVSAAIALGEAGDDRCGDTLLAVLRGDLPERDPGKVQAAFELSGELGLQGARELASTAAFGLRGRLGADPGRRTAAMTALVRLGDRRAIDHVLAELSGTSFTRRAHAIGIAGRAALSEARPRLLALREDPARADPEAVDDALARIASAARRG